jgi:hypothetical protein
MAASRITSWLAAFFGLYLAGIAPAGGPNLAITLDDVLLGSTIVGPKEIRPEFKDRVVLLELWGFH